MKLRLVIMLSFFCLFNSVQAQSTSAAIDSLIKYRIITVRERPILEKELRDTNSQVSDHVKILGGLQYLLLKKTFHTDPHKTGLMYSYSGHPNKKTQDSINATLHILLEKIKKAGILTDRVYSYTREGVDSGRYVAELQMIGSLAEMGARLELLAPNKLQPFVQNLHSTGIVSDSSFLQFENDLDNGKIESVFQLNDYCKLDKVFDLTKYPNDPDIWLEQLHRDIASMLPGLNFTDFSYSTIPDTSFSLPGVKFKISLVCNGHTYQHTSLAFNSFKKTKGKISPKDVFVEDFYRIFNKILIDQGYPCQLHSIMFSPGKTTDYHFRHFALIALNNEQVEVFMKKPNYDFMSVSMDSYDPTVTSAKTDSTIIEWRKIGLFAHLSNAQISKAIEDVKADDLFSINKLLSNFPGVVYHIDSIIMSQKPPYVNILRRISQITHGAFHPTKVMQKKVKGGMELQYFSNGKTHFYKFTTANGWWDDNFSKFTDQLSLENNLGGKFYLLSYFGGVIYLTYQQHNYAVKHKLLDFE